MSKLNVQFNAAQTAALERMARDAGMTKAGVLKTALALLDACVREVKAGNTIAVIRGDRVLKEIVILG